MEVESSKCAAKRAKDLREAMDLGVGIGWAGWGE